MRDEMQAIFGNLLDTVFNESVTAFTGQYQGAGTTDPVSEVTTKPTITYSGRGVFYNYDASRVDGVNILVGDVQLIALVNEVEARPQVGHLFSTTDIVPILGVAMAGYRVVTVGGDPAGVHHDVQLRKA